MFASLRKASSASDWNSRPSTVQPSIFEMHRETGFSSSRFRFYYPPPLRQQLQVSLRSVFFELSISKSRRRKTCFPPETWKVTDGGPMHVASSPCGQWRHGRPRTRRAGGGADWAARGRPKSGWPAAVAVSVIAAVASASEDHSICTSLSSRPKTGSLALYFSQSCRQFNPSEPGQHSSHFTSNLFNFTPLSLISWEVRPIFKRIELF